MRGVLGDDSDECLGAWTKLVNTVEIAP